MTTDPMDQPEEDDGYGLVYPFTVCASVGGPYDDNAFVAGVQLGRIHEALAAAAAIRADRLRFTVYTSLVKQLELVGMAQGFPLMAAEQCEDTDEGVSMAEWTFMTFERS